MTETRTLHVDRSTSTAHRLTHYDGVCGNIHGHNLNWEAEVEVEMDEDDEANMPVDFKDITNVIDRVDHAVLLNYDDPLVRALMEDDPTVTEPYADPEDGGLHKHFESNVLGEVWFFEGDPTCEVLAPWMARAIFYEFDPVVHVNITVHETDKYGTSSHYSEYDAREEAYEDDE